MGDISTGGAHPWDTGSSRDCTTWDPTTSTLLLLLLLCHIHQGNMALTLLVLLLYLLLLLLLRCHHGWMAHLVHHRVPLLRRHPLACPLLLLLLMLLRVLERRAHPRLLKLHLRRELALGQVTLRRGLLHGPPGANHHRWWSTLWLIHVGSRSSHCSLGLRRHALGSTHPPHLP